MTRVRNKRQAEQMAYDVETSMRWDRILQKLKEPGEGYGSVAPISLLALQICKRCSAIIYGPERHTAWHDSHG